MGQKGLASVQAIDSESEGMAVLGLFIFHLENGKLKCYNLFSQM